MLFSGQRVNWVKSAGPCIWDFHPILLCLHVLWYNRIILGNCSPIHVFETQWSIIIKLFTIRIRILLFLVSTSNFLGTLREPNKAGWNQSWLESKKPFSRVDFLPISRYAPLTAPLPATSDACWRSGACHRCGLSMRYKNPITKRGEERERTWESPLSTREIRTGWWVRDKG